MILYNDNCLRVLEAIGRVRCIVADPPDNIGLPYNMTPDELTYEVYRTFIESLILKALVKCEIFWLSVYYKNLLMIGGLVENILRVRHPSWKARVIIWRYTFGQYSDKQIPNGYRPIILMMAPGVQLNYDAIRCVSERMLLGDSRAAGPRIPDDVWEIPRVVGNSKERRPWHPTQHPEELIERILKLSSLDSKTTDPYGTVFDCFAGTGTVLRVANRLGIPCSAAELDPYYCTKIQEEIPGLTINKLYL